MVTWIYMLVVCMLIPLSLIWMWYYCPRIKSVSSWKGYRTSRSTKNEETWRFAQMSCAKNSLRMSLPTACLALVGLLFVLNRDNNTIQYVGLGITMLQLLSYGVVMYLTEKDLKSNFDEMGRKRK